MNKKMFINNENGNTFSEKEKLIGYIDYILANDEDLQDQGKEVLEFLKSLLIKTNPGISGYYYLYSKDIPRYVIENASCLRIIINTLNARYWEVSYDFELNGKLVLIPPNS